MSDVDIKIGADTTDLTKGAADVNAKLDQITAHVGTIQSTLNTMAADMKSSFDTLGEAIGGLEQDFKDLNESIEKGGSVLQVSWLKSLGAVGIASAGVLAVLHSIGEGFLKMERSAREANISLERFQELQYVMNQSGAGTDKLEKDLEEAGKKLNELTHDAGDLGKFLDENDIKWKDSKDKIIDMNRYIEVSVQLIANAATQGDRFKAAEILGWSKEFARAVQNGTVSLEMLTQKAHEVGAVLDHDAIQKAIEFENDWNKASLEWSEYFKHLIVDLTPYVMQLIGWLGKAVEYVSFVATELGKAFKEDFAEALKPPESKGAAGPFAGLPGTLSALVATNREFFSITNNTEKTWQMIVDDATKLNKEVMKSLVESFPAKDPTKFPKDDKDDTKEKLAGLNQQLDALSEYYQRMKIMEDSAVSRSVETEGQKVAHLLNALNQWGAGAKTIYDKEVAIADDDANKVAEIRRKMARTLENIDKQRLVLEEEQLKKSTQEWESVLSTIEGAWNSQLKGLLAHTTSWSQAMKNIVSQLVLKMIEEFEKLAIIKPLSAMLANSLSAPTELFAGLVKAIGAMLGPLTAGFTSFFAPTLGPAAPAAGAAAAATEVAVAKGLVSYDVGTQYVPRTGMALIHQGEAIIPANQNPFVGGQGLGVSPVFNIHALDASGVQAFFTRFGPQIAKMLSAHMNQNPSTFNK